jgi:hypothetical protein
VSWGGPVRRATWSAVFRERTQEVEQ